MTSARIQPIVQVDAPEYGDHDAILTEEIAKDLIGREIKVNPIKKVKDLNRSVGVYGEIDLLLGMRMHSNILASLQSTPFVAISYEHKTDGIVQELGMKNYCIKVQEANRKFILTKLMHAYKEIKNLQTKIDKRVGYIRRVESNRWVQLLEAVN